MSPNNTSQIYFIYSSKNTLKNPKDITHPCLLHIPFILTHNSHPSYTAFSNQFSAVYFFKPFHNSSSLILLYDFPK